MSKKVSPVVSDGWIQTLNLRIRSRVFDHCATTTGHASYHKLLMGPVLGIYISLVMSAIVCVSVVIIQKLPSVVFH